MPIAKHSWDQRVSADLPLPGGYVMLISILVIGAAGLAIAVTLLLSGVGVSRASFTLEQSGQAKALANTCAEKALQKIHDSISFIGTESFSLGQGACTFTVVSLGGQAREVTASGTVGTVVRKVKVILNQITPTISVASWGEVADF